MTLFKALPGHEGVMPVLAMKDTVYRSENGTRVDGLLERGSAEPAVLAGMDIVMIPGDEDNIKVTTDADMRRFLEQVKSLF